MRELLILLLRCYKRGISPMLPGACRFHPSCSEYMLGSIERYGTLRGVTRGFIRLLKCNPFHSGGFDPVR